tara:strand:- start:1975 stop:2121 length:147 start_codon:yes stop_codon:yes gene_type:complete
MLIDTLLQLNPDAVVTEREGFVVIEIPDHQDPEPDAEADGEARPDADM